MTRGGSVYAYVTDNTGSVTALIDTSGNTAASYAYDPYGNTTATSGAQATTNLLGYTGAMTDPGLPASSGTPSTGYTHLGQRWQNPATGAFTTQDTSSYLANPGNGNRYAYAADNPINNTDPTGAGSCASSLGSYALAGGIFLGATESAAVGIGLATGEELALIASGAAISGGILGVVFALGFVAIGIANC